MLHCELQGRREEGRGGEVNDAIKKIKKLYIVSISFHLFGLIIRFEGVWEEEESKRKYWICIELDWIEKDDVSLQRQCKI